jgi:hypothetical protein
MCRRSTSNGNKTEDEMELEIAAALADTQGDVRSVPDIKIFMFSQIVMFKAMYGTED